MKFLMPLLLTWFCTPTYAGPGDGPIVPWPTSVRETIQVEELLGTWVAYDFNSVWNINIYPLLPGSNVVYVDIQSAALFTQNAQGILNDGDGLFWGDIIMDESHRSQILIYRDSEGTKLRLGKNKNKFFDMKLYRNTNERSHD